MFSQIIVTGALCIALLFMTASPHLAGLVIQLAHADFNFGTVGDWGCSKDNTVKTRDNIRGKNPERVLGLGDYSYDDTAKCWLDIINESGKSIKSITRINIGNHEVEEGNGPQQYLNAFGNPNPPLAKQYYSFNYVNAHVLIMATDLSYKEGSAQFIFVKDDLEKAAANPNIKWSIVDFHRLMYTSPNSCFSCGGISSLRNLYHPLFDKNKVDLVLQGT